MEMVLGWVGDSGLLDAAARVVLGLIGAAMLIGQLVLAGYAVPKVVRFRTKVFIAGGAGSGAGALHAAVMGSLLQGVVCATVAGAFLFALLWSQAGVSRRRRVVLSPGADLSHTQAWLRGLVEHAHDLREAVSDWGELNDTGSKRRDAEARDGQTKG